MRSSLSLVIKSVLRKWGPEGRFKPTGAAKAGMLFACALKQPAIENELLGAFNAKDAL